VGVRLGVPTAQEQIRRDVLSNCQAQIVWPDHYTEYDFPPDKISISNSEQPTNEPNSTCKRRSASTMAVFVFVCHTILLTLQLFFSACYLMPRSIFRLRVNYTILCWQIQMHAVLVLEGMDFMPSNVALYGGVFGKMLTIQRHWILTCTYRLTYTTFCLRIMSPAWQLVSPGGVIPCLVWWQNQDMSVHTSLYHTFCRQNVGKAPTPARG